MLYTDAMQHTGRVRHSNGRAGGAMVNMDRGNTTETTGDISRCRALDVGIKDFAECLCAGPNACQFALPFGYAFLCRHPRMSEILENTRKLGQAITAES